MPTMKPYTPPLANTTWDSVYNPQQASIFDSTLEKVVRTLATITGINDPTQIPAALTTVTPAGPATGGLAKVIDDLVKNRQAIKAYHGSPHDFDQFSLDKIGTGEGAQAYGHGLYFAETPEVAKSYRDALKWRGSDWESPQIIAANSLEQAGGDRARAAARLKEALAWWEKNPTKNPSQVASNERTRAALDLIMSGGDVSGKPPQPGRMYEVAIKASPDDFLDWDKPLSQQSEKVRQAVGNIGAPVARDGMSLAGGGTLRVVDDPDLGPKYFLEMGDSRFKLSPSDVTNLIGSGREGKSAYQALVEVSGNQVKASERLKQAGIPGLKYLDAGSRSAGDGSRNYVVFDDKLIEILRKWGLLPFAVGAGAQQAQTAEAK